ncbi:MAG: nitrilase family protein [Muribaculum sp.]|nr:nitrilase family protein [Muribaculaceae bacterium]MCM1080937.1 nitrilase family protein [Muribaculum sp.]
MSNNLKVAAIQLNIAWGDIDTNLIEAEKLIASLPEGYDLAVLPEMFTTGFIVERDLALKCAETINGHTLNKMRLWAKKYNLAVAGSVIVAEGEKLKNRAYFVEPSGEVTEYDKHHLFEISGENLIYASGERPIPIVRYRGWNIAMAVCFDLRFPAWLRSDKGGYDLLLVMANWPDTRLYAWEHLLIARAIENQAYVIGANRSGIDNYGVYSQTSKIIDPKGLPVGDNYSELIHTSDLNKEMIEAFRGKFPVYLLNDIIKFE